MDDFGYWREKEQLPLEKEVTVSVIVSRKVH